MAETWEATAEESLRYTAQRQAAEVEDLKARLRDAETRAWSLEAEVRKLREELARRDAGVLPFRKEVAG